MQVIWTDLGSISIVLGGYSSQKVKVDCEKYKTSCDTYGITGYPTIKLFQDGKETVYYGPREAAKLREWALTTTPSTSFEPAKPLSLPERTSPQMDFSALETPESNVVVLNDNMLNNQIYTGTWVIMVHIGSGFCKDVIPELIEVASKLTNAKVGAINVYQRDDLIKTFAVRGYPSLLLLKDGKTVQFQGMKKAEQILEFVKDHTLDQPSNPDPQAVLPSKSIEDAPSQFTNFVASKIALVIVVVGILGLFIGRLTTAKVKGE